MIPSPIADLLRGLSNEELVTAFATELMDRNQSAILYAYESGSTEALHFVIAPVPSRLMDMPVHQQLLAFSVHAEINVESSSNLARHERTALVCIEHSAEGCAACGLSGPKGMAHA